MSRAPLGLLALVAVPLGLMTVIDPGLVLAEADGGARAPQSTGEARPTAPAAAPAAPAAARPAPPAQAPADPLARVEALLLRGEREPASRLLDELLLGPENLDRLDREQKLAPALALRALVALQAGDRTLASRSFSEALAVDPAWRPSRRPGGVSPEAFELFEEVLSQSGTRPPLLLRPSRGEGPDEVAIKLHDPKTAVARAVLYARPGGERKYETAPFRGGIWGAAHQLAKVPFFEGLGSGQRYVLEYYVEGLSYSGDALLYLGRPEAPLRSPRVAPIIARGARGSTGKRWYQHRWVWIVAGVVVVGAVVGGAFAAARSGGNSGAGLALFRF